MTVQYKELRALGLTGAMERKTYMNFATLQEIFDNFTEVSHCRTLSAALPLFHKTTPTVFDWVCLCVSVCDCVCLCV